MINKYNKVLHLGDPLLVELFTGNWHIEEKVDGSQFRILVNDGKVFTGSKRVSFIDREPDKMFFKAREMAEKHFKDLLGNFVIFCEYLQKCKHNTLIYDRTPKDNIVIFDVLDLKDNKWMTYEEKGLLADAVGLECIPKLMTGKGIPDMEVITELLKTESFLGKETVEGIVVKNYDKRHTVEYLFNMPLIGKMVRKEFTERNKEAWKNNNDIITQLTNQFKTDARYVKAVQKLRDEDKLEYNLKDLRYLIPEVNKDIGEEEKEYCKEQLWKWAKRRLMSGWTRGFPEWYKKLLLEKQLAENK